MTIQFYTDGETADGRRQTAAEVGAKDFLPLPLLIALAILLIGSGLGCNRSAPTKQEKIDRFCMLYGSDVKAVDEKGLTLLHLAVAGKDNVDVVEFLIAKGADVNAKRKGSGDTPLHWAVQFDNIEIVKLLIARGADVQATNDKGSTPLDIAKFADNSAIIEYLSSLSDVSSAEQPPAERISPLDLPAASEEDFEAERERILAEERARELALIEEERKIVPMVEEPEKLLLLFPQDRLWITPDRTSVVMIGRVVLREGFLELLACRVGAKEHESILSVRVTPRHIHAALLVVNARQGKPMQFSPNTEIFVPASGDQIDITLRWKDDSATDHEAQAQDWVWDMANSPEDAKKPMATHWVFSGSREYQDDEGNHRYVADETGELFSLSNFVGSILDVPIQSSADNTRLLFGCFTERIPPQDTMVTIILTPVR